MRAKNISFPLGKPANTAQILIPEALAFLALLHEKFDAEINALLGVRKNRQAEFDAGVLPRFRPGTKNVRDGNWRAADIPTALRKRQVEITGPVDRKMIINALNSGADVFMADFEDSTSPTWANQMEGQANLFDAVRERMDHQDPKSGKAYKFDGSNTTLMVRPRGLHLKEAGMLVGGREARAALVDFGLFLFHNAKELLSRGRGPFFYLPKLESHKEAAVWNEVFNFSQDAMGIPRGSIRATVLIETLPAAFEMDEIIHALKDHSAGLNCGRWDYIFSYIKTFRGDPTRMLPDRSQVTMTQPFMRAYSQHLIRVCHRRGVHAMGGMAAQIPIKSDPVANEEATAKVRADKTREASDGHDGTWVAHPGLIPIAREAFDAVGNSSNSAPPPVLDEARLAEALIQVPEGTKTLEGLRQNVDVGVQYLAAWLNGQGCVPLYNLMEDAATAEISRSQLWQWVNHGAVLEDGTPVTTHLVTAELDKSLDILREKMGEDAFSESPLNEAAQIFLDLINSVGLQDFCTLAAYGKLRGNGMNYNETAGDRFSGVERIYGMDEVKGLRPSVQNDYKVARQAANKLWQLMKTGPYVNSLGAVTGNQAVQMAKAGLPAIYCSGWQVAADANVAGETYPDQSLYPANSVPTLVKRLNNALARAEQADKVEGKCNTDYFLPILADAEAGFGGPLNAFEMMKGMIEAGVAGVHFEDQLSSEKKCGHLGGKVLVPMQQFVRTLAAARLAADVVDVPTVLVARTDAHSATLLTSDVDARDKPFVTGDRTPEGFFRINGGIEYATARGLAYAPYADLLWCETSTPDLQEAKYFAEKIQDKFPGKMLAYNCSPSFNWKKHLDDTTIAKFQRELGAMGYKFQFITLAGFHSLNHAMFKLAVDYKERGMTAYSALQEQEFSDESLGYTATKHQREVGTGYFDKISQLVSGGESSTLALKGSTEEAQF